VGIVIRHLSFVIRHTQGSENQATSFVRVWGLFTQLSTVSFSFVRLLNGRNPCL